MPENKPHHETQEFLPVDAPAPQLGLEPEVGPNDKTEAFDERASRRARPRTVNAQVAAALTFGQNPDFLPDEPLAQQSVFNVPLPFVSEEPTPQNHA